MTSLVVAVVLQTAVITRSVHEQAVHVLLTWLSSPPGPTRDIPCSRA